MIERACGIATTAHTSNHIIWIGITQRTFQLLPDLFTDDGLKPSHHIWIWVRPNNRPNNIMCVIRVVDPMTHGFVGRIFQGHVSAEGWNHLGSENSHALHVGPLTIHVQLPHVHGALHSHQRTNSGGSYTMLTGSSFGYDFLFP